MSSRPSELRQQERQVLLRTPNVDWSMDKYLINIRGGVALTLSAEVRGIRQQCALISISRMNVYISK